MTLESITNFKYFTPNKKENRFKQPVAQYDIRGNIIRTYDCIKETKKSGYNPTIVSKCINNKIKLHDNNIFIKIKDKNNIALKIDPAPYINNRKSTMGLNNLIVNNLKTLEDNQNKKTFTIKSNGLRIGMFNKSKMLLEVFTDEHQIKNTFGHVSGVYDHLYGRITGKNKIKRGYKNLYFFKKLNVGQSYTIGEKYDFSQFEKAEPRKIKRNIIPNKNIVKQIPKVENIIPTPKVDNIIPTEEPMKKNFMQRLVYLFTGKEKKKKSIGGICPQTYTPYLL